VEGDFGIEDLPSVEFGVNLSGRAGCLVQPMRCAFLGVNGDSFAGFLGVATSKLRSYGRLSALEWIHKKRLEKARARSAVGL
jgi:hypothetical protein